MIRICQTSTVFLLLAIVAGCGTPSQASIPTTPTSTRDLQPIATITATPVPLPDTEQCVDVKKTLALPVRQAGILALYEFGEDNTAPQTRLMDFATGKFLSVNVPPSWAKPSPNYEWFMFGGFLITKPFFFGENGQLVEARYWQDDWVVDRWINDRDLLVSQSYKKDDGRFDFDNTLIRLDPFTGEWEKLPTDFPNIYVGLPPAGLAAWTSYDPSLTLATYISEDGATVFSNIQTKQIIWKREGNLPFLGEWSPDGRQFAITVWENKDTELLLVQQDGNSLQLPNIKIKNKDGFNARVNLFGWSPEGNYLLFIFGDGLDNVFGTINIHTRETKLFCFRDYLYTQDYYWSSNEKQIAFSIKDEIGWHVAILDITDGTMFYVADGAQAAGWIPTGP
ncbi:MAG: hypothetical protein L6461_23360 [Anaerolineae bacterium]|nr:hypothetical protein [Anaerolineae bacterium]